jgi:signal recognition particle subunit SRP54
MFGKGGLDAAMPGLGGQGLGGGAGGAGLPGMPGLGGNMPANLGDLLKRK